MFYKALSIKVLNWYFSSPLQTLKSLKFKIFYENHNRSYDSRAWFVPETMFKHLLGQVGVETSTCRGLEFREMPKCQKVCLRRISLVFP